MEGAEGNGDDLNIFRCAAHEDGAKKVICVPAICRDKVSISQTQNRLEPYHKVITLHRNKCTTGATMMFVYAKRQSNAMDAPALPFSSAYLREMYLRPD